ncbi:MAG: hypothetical protein V4507_10730 [Verrucomicrobiota bacterium]
MPAETNSKNKRNRIIFDGSPDLSSAIRDLSKRWNCKTNDAIARAILESLHRPLASAPEPPWAKKLKDSFEELKSKIDQVVT